MAVSDFALPVLVLFSLCLWQTVPSLLTPVQQTTPGLAGNGIDVLHQLLYQESLVRVELEKQIASLQSIVLNLQNEVRNCENGQNKLLVNLQKIRTNFSTGLKTIETKFENRQSSLSMELKAFQTKFELERNNISTEIKTMEANFENGQNNISTELRTMNTYFETGQKNLSAELKTIQTRCESEQNSLSGRITVNENNQRAMLQRLDQMQQNQSTFAKKQPAVAFLARLSHNIVNGPLYSTIIYEDVVTNIGSAYDKTTGVFIAPVSGIYEISYSISSTVGTTRGNLMKNGQEILHLYCYYLISDRWGHASNTASIHLAQGDRVYVVEADSEKAQTVHSSHAAYFSGHLVQEN